VFQANCQPSDDLNLVNDWKLEGFLTAMGSGVDPGDHGFQQQMPWRQIGKMDEDLGAIL
jgi:hypothetical protein